MTLRAVNLNNTQMTTQIRLYKSDGAHVPPSAKSDEAHVPSSAHRHPHLRVDVHMTPMTGVDYVRR